MVAKSSIHMGGASNKYRVINQQHSKNRHLVLEDLLCWRISFKKNVNNYVNNNLIEKLFPNLSFWLYQYAKRDRTNLTCHMH